MGFEGRLENKFPRSGLITLKVRHGIQRHQYVAANVEVHYAYIGCWQVVIATSFDNPKAMVGFWVS